MKTIFKNIIPTILLLVLSNTCFAHGLGGHNKELEQILFGNNLSKVSEKGKVHFRLLCEAAYLTLDYTSDNDSRDSGIRFATDLINNGVKQIPSLRDISFPANQYHQMYTHYGWDKGYRGVTDKANWKLRKQILLNLLFDQILYEVHNIQIS